MRSFFPPSWSSGESDLAEVSFDSSSRDDIPRLLRGLHYLYMTPSLRKSVFEILDEMLPSV